MKPVADHQPVMLQETLDYLEIKKDNWYIDATFGRGGHTSAILDRGGKVVAFDWDIEAIQYGQAQFAEQLNGQRLIMHRASFSEISQVANNLKQQSSTSFDGVLFDFGTSSDQLTSGDRGFSFTHQGPLDMRMDQRLGVQAMDLLAVIPENQLAEMFAEYGGETEAKKIAKAIKSSPTPITTTQQLGELVEAVKKRRSGRLHPATKVFQALRIAVNSELDEISTALPQSLEVLEPKGKIVTIAFHEGEDRLVKTAFREWQQAGKGTIETKRPITPSQQEVALNPRARSAKLRVFRKQE